MVQILKHIIQKLGGQTITKDQRGIAFVIGNPVGVVESFMYLGGNIIVLDEQRKYMTVDHEMSKYVAIKGFCYSRKFTPHGDGGV